MHTKARNWNNFSSKLLFHFHSELHIFASQRSFSKQTTFCFIASVRQAVLFNYSYQAENLAKLCFNFQLYIFQVNCFPLLAMQFFFYAFCVCFILHVAFMAKNFFELAFSFLTSKKTSGKHHYEF